jgi:hypothetical protein
MYLLSLLRPTARALRELLPGRPALHHAASGLATVALLSLMSSASTSSSVAGVRTTLPLHLDRHFPALVALDLSTSTPAASGFPFSGGSEDYLHSLPFGREIAHAADASRIDRLLLASVVETESSFRPDAVSPKGALGLMQLLPLHFDAGERPFDPRVNLAVGAEYLAELERRYDGDLELALAAYHAGPGTVARYGGLPPYRETRVYIGRVLERWRAHRASAGEAQRGS